MPKFTIKKTQIHRVLLEFTEDFDTSSQENWDQLKSRAQENMDDDEYDELPKKPPKKIEAWLALYEHIDAIEFENKSEEKWVTFEKGGYGEESEIIDSNGNVVLRSMN